MGILRISKLSCGGNGHALRASSAGVKDFGNDTVSLTLEFNFVEVEGHALGIVF